MSGFGLCVARVTMGQSVEFLPGRGLVRRLDFERTLGRSRDGQKRSARAQFVGDLTAIGQRLLFALLTMRFLLKQRFLIVRLVVRREPIAVERGGGAAWHRRLRWRSG